MAEVEHLKIIQGIVARLAGNSFLLKGWAVTLVAGLTALAKADTDRDVAWIAFAVVVVFGILDSYYLALERSFRDLYEEVVLGVTGPWSLRTAKISPLKVLAAFSSFSVWPLYTVGAVAASVVATSL